MTNLLNEPHIALAPLVTFCDNMITKSDQFVANGLWREAMEMLFGSRVRIDLMAAFILHPEEATHARAIAGQIDAQYSAVWRELRKLERAGLLTSEMNGRTKSYRLNPDFPLLPELRAILLKTVAAGKLIRRGISSLGDLQVAFIYGSVASAEIDQASDIDLMLLGHVDLQKLTPLVAELERQLGREVNYLVFTPAEWRAKVEGRDPLALNVMEAPKVMLVGDEDALRGIAEAGKD
jgi:predicted nucleotidyltransferase